MFFYEIHEGDDELGTAVLLVHAEHIEPKDFLAMVKTARAVVVDSHEEDTLAEAIANELERSHGFTHITDERLLASVNVDDTEENTFLVTGGENERTVFVTRDLLGDDDRPH